VLDSLDFLWGLNVFLGNKAETSTFYLIKHSIS